MNMEKKENEVEIATNMSSGAEKVENIGERADAKAGAAGAVNAAGGKAETKKADRRAEKAKRAQKKGEQKEKAAAKKRVDAALEKERRKAQKEERKAALKAKRQEKKLQMEEKRRAHEAKMAEEKAARIAERRARKELLKNETKAQRIERRQKERAEKIALKKQKREQEYNLKLERRDARLKAREQRLKDRQHRRENRRAPGFGGWLAAVISLGVVTLALTAVVTMGAFDMAEMNAAMSSAYRGTLYELVGIMENADTDLSKVRISASPEQQSRLLTDLLLQARLAESSLERFPIPAEADAGVTTFINRTAAYSQGLLDKLRAGGTLSDADLQKLESLYKTNRQVRDELNRLALAMTDKDMEMFMKSAKENEIGKSFQSLENLTVGDGEEALEEKEQGVAEEEGGITSVRAEELCGEYFSEYGVERADYAGETSSKEVPTYNFFLYDGQGKQIFAQISKKDGALARFEFYEHCTDKNFDLGSAKTIAEEYLASLGYENMSAVWVNENGTLATFHFAYESDGAVFYPDLVKVKVCETKGKAVGLDATAFLKNHRTRGAVSATLTRSEAREKLSDRLNVESSRLTVVPVRGKEVTAYEFLCEYEGERYFVYIDADTGEEVMILSVLLSGQGQMIL